MIKSWLNKKSNAEDDGMLIKSFMNRSLKTRMMLLYTLLAVVLVGGISYYAYSFTVGLLKEKEM